MKIKTTLAVFGAILALSACTQVSTTPTTSPAEVTTEATDAPATTVAVKPLVLPTAVPTTAAEAPSLDEMNDMTVSPFEWAVITDVIADEGFTGWSVSAAQFEELGTNLCSIAHDSATQDDFGSALESIASGSDIDTYEVGFVAGTVMTAMCVDELTALGL